MGCWRHCSSSHGIRSTANHDHSSSCVLCCPNLCDSSTCVLCCPNLCHSSSCVISSTSCVMEQLPCLMDPMDMEHMEEPSVDFQLSADLQVEPCSERSNDSAFYVNFVSRSL